MNNIKILYTPENKDFFATLVSIQSVILNNVNNSLEFNIVIDENFETAYIKRFQNLEKYDNAIRVNILQENSEKYKNVSKKIYYCPRLFLFNVGNLFKDDEKILYLHSYSIVNSDLSNLFSTDIKNYTAAAVQSCLKVQDMGFENKNYGTYVILINLHNWKKEQIFEHFVSANFINNINKKGLIFDSDIFNCIVSQCKSLPLKYSYTEVANANNVELPPDKKFEYLNFLLHIKIPDIISIIGGKPLTEEMFNLSYANLWWQYAKQTEIYDEIKDFEETNKYKLSATFAQNSFKYTWLLSRIWPYIKPYWFRILIGFAITIPLGLLDGVTAFILKPYMDYVIGGKVMELSWHGVNLTVSSLQLAFILPFGIILFAVVQGVLRYLNSYLSTWTSVRITNDVKFTLFHKLVNMHAQFFDVNSSGIINSRFLGDPKTASAGIVDQIKSITTNFCSALGLIAVMLYSSWKLAFVGVLILFIAFIPVALIRKRIRETSNKSMVIGGKLSTNVNETYHGNKVMIAYGLQDRQEEIFREKTWESYNLTMSLRKRTAWMSPLMYQIASFGIAAVLGVGTYLVSTGSMTAGSFASFITSLLLLYKPVKSIGETFTGIQTIFVAMGRMFELFDLEPAIKEAENPKEMTGLKEKISFEDVVFEYNPNKPVLKNINLVIQKNETLAVVGNSGGGKSTLVSLIPRFYDIKSGSIKFDNVDIKEFSLKSLRYNISMVFQDNFLYSGTIKENILMGNYEADEDALANAIKYAHLEDVISELPNGLDTEIGERGLTLSGGQRQRV
ncbi:MAG: ABC transporter transmembrane domain-containing protein, partial [Candidatus Gastranaerophilaceae bacterium]